MVSFLNHIASVLSERGHTCGAVYPLYIIIIISLEELETGRERMRWDFVTWKNE